MRTRRPGLSVSAMSLVSSPSQPCGTQWGDVVPYACEACTAEYLVHRNKLLDLLRLDPDEPWPDSVSPNPTPLSNHRSPNPQAARTGAPDSYGAKSGQFRRCKLGHVADGSAEEVRLQGSAANVCLNGSVELQPFRCREAGTGRRGTSWRCRSLPPGPIKRTVHTITMATTSARVSKRRGGRRDTESSRQCAGSPTRSNP